MPILHFPFYLGSISMLPGNSERPFPSVQLLYVLSPVLGRLNVCIPVHFFIILRGSSTLSFDISVIGLHILLMPTATEAWYLTFEPAFVVLSLLVPMLVTAFAFLLLGVKMRGKTLHKLTFCGLVSGLSCELYKRRFCLSQPVC